MVLQTNPEVHLICLLVLVSNRRLDLTFRGGYHLDVHSDFGCATLLFFLNGLPHFVSGRLILRRGIPELQDKFPVTKRKSPRIIFLNGLHRNLFGTWRRLDPRTEILWWSSFLLPRCENLIPTVISAMKLVIFGLSVLSDALLCGAIPSRQVIGLRQIPESVHVNRAHQIGRASCRERV